MIQSTWTHNHDVVSLEVPGRIECRDVVLRIVSASCKLLESHARGGCPSDFSSHLVTAVSEAYNNIVLHGYSGIEPGSVFMQIENSPKSVRVMIKDTGASFDPDQAPRPDLATLPESGLGIFVIRACVDEVSYVPGPPNVLTLVKSIPQSRDTDRAT